MLYPDAVNANGQHRRQKSDFYFLQSIGEGSYSKVYRCCEKGSNKTYAIKEVSKRLLMREGKERYAFREKKALSLLTSSPYFVHLYFTFQDEDSLYYGISYYSNGDLLDLILKHNGFTIASLVFYTAELIDAIVFMHQQHVIHRDLKPENILLDDRGHIKITDFGSCRVLDGAEHEEAVRHADDDELNEKDALSEESVATRIISQANKFLGNILLSYMCSLLIIPIRETADQEQREL